MQDFDHRVIREALRHVHKAIGCSKFRDLIPLLQGIDSSVDERLYDKYVEDQVMGKRDIQLITPKSAKIISSKISSILDNIVKLDGHLVEYALKILQKEKYIVEESWSGQDILSLRWKESPLRGNKLLLSGVYQIFRRETPLDDPKKTIFSID